MSHSIKSSPQEESTRTSTTVSEEPDQEKEWPPSKPYPKGNLPFKEYGKKCAEEFLDALNRNVKAGL